MCPNNVCTNCFFRVTFHKRYMFVCCCMKYNGWSISFKYFINAFFIIYATYNNMKLKSLKHTFFHMSFNFHLNLISIVFIKIKNNDCFWLIFRYLTNKFATNRSTTTCYENNLIFNKIFDTAIF